MMRSYLRRWLNQTTSPRRSSPRAARKRRPLDVEQLERREVPTISISNATPVTEGNFNSPGVKTGLPNTANFTVTLSAPLANDVTVDYSTSNGTADGVRVVRVASGLARPLAARTAPGDNNRLFIAEQFSGTNGRIRILDRSTGVLQTTADAFLTFGPVSTANEQGLLGLAFDPDYQNNGFFYVNFTTGSPPAGIPTGAAGATVVRRYQVMPGDPNHANPASATTILGFAQPQSNHNGGWLEFGADGFLYIATGDGGGANDQHTTPVGGNGQWLGTMLGKVLRVDVSGDDFPGDDTRNYRIPPSNPFVGVAGALPEIWSFGLRNPFRAGFDRFTGDLYIGDVGQGAREEIDFQPASSSGGENYGWRSFESVLDTGMTPDLSPSEVVFPILDLLRPPDPNGAVAVIGGYVYRGPIPELQGFYFFGESNNSRVWAARYDGTTPFNGLNFTNFARWSDGLSTVPDLLIPDRDGTVDPSIATISSLGQDNAGNLFIVDGFGNEVFQIVEGGDFARVRGAAGGVAGFTPLTIVAGQTSAVISVQIVGDALDEANETFFVNLSNPVGDTILDGQGQGTINDDDVTTLTKFLPTATGFVAEFSSPVDANVLNLVDTQAGALGPADALLISGSGVPVQGSLVIDRNGMRATFIRTGGLLEPGGYNATLRSAANGFRSPFSGDPLDGDDDGIPGGDFIGGVNIVSIDAVTIGVPDIARGPGQSVDLPLTLNNSSGITSIELTLRYDPRLLTINSASLSAGVPVGATVQLLPTGLPGVLRVLFSSPPLSPGLSEFVRLSATVPNSASSLYSLKHVLDLTSITVNGSSNVLDDDGVHVNGYFGDLSGNGRISATDATLALRIAVGLDSGLAAYQAADPRLLADINGSGLINSTDANLILREAVGIDQPQIPPIPVGAPLMTPFGPDPLLNLPTNFAGRVGDLITVPINLDMSDGLESGDLALSYDITRLEIRSDADIVRGTLTNDFDVFLANHDAVTGTIRVGLGRTAGPIAGRGAGSVLRITFRIRDNAPPGGAIINLEDVVPPTQTMLNEGGLVLNPAPSDTAGDVLDGLITVLAPPTFPLATVESVLVNNGDVQRSRVTSLTVTFSSMVRFLGDPAAAFRVATRKAAVGLTVALSLDATGTKTVARLTFTGRSIRNGSLADGRYTLTVDGEQIVDNADRLLDGDSNGTPGGDATAAFFRLFGDANGNADVERTEKQALRSAFGLLSGDPNFPDHFDYNGDGRISGKDLGQLVRRLRKRI